MEHREVLRPAEALVYSLVRGIAPHDDIEREHIAEVLAWIQSGVNIFRVGRPDQPPKHLVSYFLLIDPEHGSLLLADHIKAQLWLPSGRHVEPGEDPKETVIREAQEELGKKAAFLRRSDKPCFVGIAQTVGLTAGHTDVSLWYLLRGRFHEHLTFDRREFNDVAWFTFDEILESSPDTFDPHMHRFAEKLIEYLGRLSNPRSCLPPMLAVSASNHSLPFAGNVGAASACAYAARLVPVRPDAGAAERLVPIRRLIAGIGARCRFEH